MSRAPNSLAIVDVGGATTAVALAARVADRWRLLGGLAGPSGTPEAALLEAVAARALSVAPDLLAAAELEPAALERVPRLSARSLPPATLLVLGATGRAVGELADEARKTGWRVETASTETHDPREMTELALAGHVGAVLIGAGDPPGPDERAALDDLSALGGAVARRRPDVRVLLAGAMRGRRAWYEALGDAALEDPARFIEVAAVTTRREGGPGVRRALDGLRDDPADGRRALRASAGSLADLLDRRVEIIDVGFDGGARILAEPGVAGADASSEAVFTAEGCLVRANPTDEDVDAVLAWSTGSLDRHRMADRLRELRDRPWIDAAGDGARLRLAAASAALTRIANLTPEFDDRPAPDLTIVSGGAFATVPPSAISLAFADTIRRVGVTQLALDQARVLGPIGTIENPAERAALLADLLRDALVPLGTSIVVGGPATRATRRGQPRPIGRLRLEQAGVEIDRDLVAGDIQFVDLPAGSEAQVRIDFSDAVRFGRRTRHLAVPVSGGLSGVLVDLRPVPLQLPDRRDRRRALLADWTARVWPRDDR